MSESVVPDPFKAFKVNPELLSEGKKITNLMNSDLITFTVQVVASGGENRLHSHSNIDAIWFVLGGEVTFYTEVDREVAKLNKHDGHLIPRGTPYWFDSTSDDPLVIRHITARDPSISAKRIEHAPRKYAGVAESGLPQRRVTALEGQRFGG